MNIRFLMCGEDLSVYWADVSRMLAPVVDNAARGEFTLEDIRSAVENEKMIVAVCSKGEDPMFSCAFEFKHYPQYMTVNIVAAGGRLMGEVAEIFLDTFKSWAKGAGAKYIEADVSEAMERMLVKQGFTFAYQRVRLGL